MNKEQLIASIGAIGKSKIDESKVIEILKEVLQNLAKKKFGNQSMFDVVIDKKTGDLEIWKTRTVVEDDSEDAGQHHTITLSEARKIESDFEVGESVSEKVSIDIFSRREVLEGLKLFIRKKNELEQDRTYKEYQALEGKIISVQVAHTYPSIILYDDEKNELFLPKSGQIPRERFKKGDYLRAMVSAVERKGGRVRIILSRSSPAYLEGILRLEIPEILDGIVTIRHVVRLPGIRSKVVVQSEVDHVDPVGACIGPGGRRIQAISKEHLGGERIDIIAYSDNAELLIKRMINIKVPNSISVVDKGHEIVIYNNDPSQISIIQQNASFASKILNRPVRVVQGPATEEDIDDVYLTEFANEISQEIIDILKQEGFHTAKQLLNTPKKEIKSKIDLDQESIDNLYAILAAEFA